MDTMAGIFPFPQHGWYFPFPTSALNPQSSGPRSGSPCRFIAEAAAKYSDGSNACPCVGPESQYGQRYWHLFSQHFTDLCAFWREFFGGNLAPGSGRIDKQTPRPPAQTCSPRKAGSGHIHPLPSFCRVPCDGNSIARSDFVPRKSAARKGRERVTLTGSFSR